MLRNYVTFYLTLVTLFFTNLGYVVTIRTAISLQFGNYLLGAVDVVVVVIDIFGVLASIIFSRTSSLHNA